MRNRILHIIIFLFIYSFSYAYPTCEKRNTISSAASALNDSIIFRQNIYDITYLDINGSLKWTEVKAELSDVKIFKPFADDDWWTNPPTSGSGTGTFVGGAPIGDEMGLLILFGFFFALFKIKNKRM